MFSESLSSALMDRRTLLKAGAATALSIPGARAAQSRRVLDFKSPEDNVYAWLKIYGDIAGDVEVYSWFGGDIAAVIGNKRPEPILGFEGFAVNRLVPQDNGDYKVFINEVAFYKDLASDDIIDKWDNPFNGETVDVWQLHAGPLTNMVTTIRKRELPDGDIEETPFILPWFVVDDDAFMSIEFNDVRDNPMSPERWPRESAGEKVRVSESMQFMAKLADLENPDITNVATSASWTLMRSWLPWMLMGRSEGHLYHRNVVNKVGGIEQIPERLLKETEQRFPEFSTSPPDDSFGQRMTSYKVYEQERVPVPEAR